MSRHAPLLEALMRAPQALRPPRRQRRRVPFPSTADHPEAASTTNRERGEMPRRSWRRPRNRRHHLFPARRQQRVKIARPTSARDSGRRPPPAAAPSACTLELPHQPPPRGRDADTLGGESPESCQPPGPRALTSIPPRIGTPINELNDATQVLQSAGSRSLR